jgi:glycine cleavage system H protein
MSCPKDLLYTSDHEWARVVGNTVTVGITKHAQDALGDVVFVELPDLEQELESGDSFGVVESVKAVNDLYSPCQGVVVEVNEALNDQPELINQDPYGDGWVLKLTISGSDAVAALLSPDQYDALVEQGG